MPTQFIVAPAFSPKLLTHLISTSPQHSMCRFVCPLFFSSASTFLFIFDFHYPLSINLHPSAITTIAYRSDHLLSLHALHISHSRLPLIAPLFTVIPFSSPLHINWSRFPFISFDRHFIFCV